MRDGRVDIGLGVIDGVAPLDAYVLSIAVTDVQRIVTAR
jgi:hypothetical protein